MPRKYRRLSQSYKVECEASMRPGRMPRKYQRNTCYSRTHSVRFNEAGADAPEIPGFAAPRPSPGTALQ